MPCTPYDSLESFRLKNIEHIQEGVHGIYGFWYRKRRCIYIGKAVGQTISERLEQHWRDTHNHLLRDWMYSKGKEMMFTYKVIEEPILIDKFERYYINKYKPVANIIRYKRS